MDQRSLARFMSKIVVRVNGCWHLPPNHKDGYAAVWSSGKYRLAHRLSYEHFIGAIPEGRVLDHLCHTNDLSCLGGTGCLHRRCVNPSHLEPVTELENNQRGRGVAALNAQKEACKNGHPFTTRNTYTDRRGRRECRTCRAELSKAWVEKHHPGVRHGTEAHCPSGHAYAGDNLLLTARGSRACRECKRAGNREYMRAKRAAARPPAK